MGYRVARSEELEPSGDRDCDMRRLTEAAGLSNVAVNRFRPDPGQQLPLVYHYHDEQEEAFYVVEGRIEVETPEETYELAAGDLLAVDPGSPQRAYNPADADGPADVIAIGSPPVSGDAHKYEP